MNLEQDLAVTIERLIRPGKGILAADESVPTITKRLAAVGVESTSEARRAWRELLLGAESIGDYLSGVILFEETLQQETTDGVPLGELAERQGIVPGIKVDKGTIPLANGNGDKITQGLDGLAERLQGYYRQGARFTKWRNVFPITPFNPTSLGIRSNAEVLARYAAVVQEAAMVPIVEPEVLMDGGHDIERCAEVTQAVLDEVFNALARHRVRLEYVVLKPNMVIPGKDAPKAPPETVAEYTVNVLRRTVPPAVPSINFLSGGQGAEEATHNLDAINRHYPGAPWVLSFSYARALQAQPMEIWRGEQGNVSAAREKLLQRARLNSAAREGRYDPSMEEQG